MTPSLPASSPPTSAMLLAAGLGLRMRPLTAETAKPLLPLAGRALLDHALDRLAAAGIVRVVVNGHWQAERARAHLAARQGGPETVFREEPALLDTGGAVRAALAEGLLGEDVAAGAPFFVINGDAFWLDGPRPALSRLAAAWAEQAIDVLLLCHRTCQVMADVGAGDFLIDPWGVPRRRGPREIAPYVFAGVQLVSPRLFGDGGDLPAAFSMNRLWDQAIAAGRARALVHDGLWFHLSTPDDLAAAEIALRHPAIGATR
jgi:MurNAc alpha-1-phosphate uridylyltransferase